MFLRLDQRYQINNGVICLKIKNIKINSFGKINNKEYDFSEKINLIYGKNEAGKSTLLKFIQSIFYGTSKNKKGKNFSDYDLYKPWGDGDFSGKLKYKLDSGEEFEYIGNSAKKILRYIMKIQKIYQNNLIQIKIQEMNSFLNKQKLMNLCFYLVLYLCNKG